MSETVRSSIMNNVYFQRAVTTGAALSLAGGIGLLAAGCSAGTDSTIGRSPSATGSLDPSMAPSTAMDVPTVTPTEAVTTTSAADKKIDDQIELWGYLDSAERTQKIEAAVNKFGRAVLVSAESGSSEWAPFDSYCASDNRKREGWTSQGYEPKKGDECSVQHHKDYGGTEDGIDVTVTIGKGGNYTNDISQVGLDTPECRQITVHKAGDEWVTNITDPKGRELGSYKAKNIADVQTVDNMVLKCLTPDHVTR